MSSQHLLAQFFSPSASDLNPLVRNLASGALSCSKLMSHQLVSHMLQLIYLIQPLTWHLFQLHYMSISETMSLGIDWTSLPVHANIDFSCLMFLVTVSTLNCSTFPLSGLVKSLFTIGVHGVADDVENMMILCYSRLTFDSTWLIVSDIYSFSYLSSMYRTIG